MVVMEIRKPAHWEKLLAIVVGISLGILISTSANANLDSTYEKYSRSAKVLYAAHELDKY
jgi:hypothetical protein